MSEKSFSLRNGGAFQRSARKRTRRVRHSHAHDPDRVERLLEDGRAHELDGRARRSVMRLVPQRELMHIEVRPAGYIS